MIQSEIDFISYFVKCLLALIYLKKKKRKTSTCFRFVLFPFQIVLQLTNLYFYFQLLVDLIWFRFIPFSPRSFPEGVEIYVLPRVC